MSEPRQPTLVEVLSVFVAAVEKGANGIEGAVEATDSEMAQINDMGAFFGAWLAERFAASNGLKPPSLLESQRRLLSKQQPTKKSPAASLKEDEE